MKFPIIYEQNATDFFSLGMGVLTNAIRAEVTEERNGSFFFEGTFLTDDELFPLIKENRILRVDAGHTLKDQRFRIKRIVPKHDNTALVYAEHISYVTQELSLKPQVFIEDRDGSGALDIWKKAILDTNEIRVSSDVRTTGKTSWHIKEVSNAREALGGVRGSILDVWGGEYRFDNYHISLLTKRGKTQATMLAYGRNIIDFEQERNIMDTFTSVYPYATYTDENQKEHLVTVDKYIIDSEHASKFPNRKALPIDFSSEFDDKNVPDAKKLKALAEKYIKNNEVGVPKTSIKLKFVDLSKTLEYKDIAPLEQLSLCDEVNVHYEKLGVNTSAKVIKTVWNVIDESYTEILIGEKRVSLSESIISKDQEIKTQINDMKSDVNYSLLAANGKNTIFYGLYGEDGKGEPKATMVGDMWYKPNGEDTEFYIWNGTIWEFIMTTGENKIIKNEIEKLEKEFDEEKDRVDKALENAEKSLDIADEARKEAFDSKLVADTAKQDSKEALLLGQGNHVKIEELEDTIKLTSSKVEANKVDIASIKIKNNEISSTVSSMQVDIANIESASDRNYIIGTSDAYKNVSFDGSVAPPDPPEDLVEVKISGYDENWKELYSYTEKHKKGSTQTFNARVLSGYDIVGSSSKTETIREGLTVSFNYKEKTVVVPPEKVSVTIKYVDENALLIDSKVEMHEVNTYVTFYAIEIAGYELVSDREQKAYITKGVVVTFIYKKKETEISNIVKNPERELTILGGDSNPTERYLCDTVAPANKLNLNSGDYVAVQFEMTQHNISGTDGMLQFAIRDGVELSYYIDINSIPKSGKFTGTFRVSGISVEESLGDEIVTRTRDFPTGKSIKIKNLSIKKISQTRMNLQLFSNNLSGLVKIGQIDIDERFSNEPSFLVSCYVDTDYDTGLEIILKNSYGSEIKRIKSQGSKRSGFIECEVPHVQGVKTIEVYLANRSTYSYNKGRYKWLQGELGKSRTPWKPAPEDLATQIEMSNVTQTVKGLQVTVQDKANQSEVTIMSNQLNSTIKRVDGTESRITQLSDQINLKVSKQEFNQLDNTVSNQQSQIKLLSDNINLKVSKNDVVASINISPEYIRIDAKRIRLSGTSLIDDAVIKSAMIDTVTANKINTGTLNGANVNVINLNAYNVTTGFLSSDRLRSRSIRADHLEADAVTVGFNTSSTSIKLYGDKIEYRSGNTLTGRITSEGQEFWYGSRKIGHVGETYKAGDSNVRGIGNRLDYNGDFISWSYKKYASSTSFTSMLTLDPNGKFTGKSGVIVDQDLYINGDIGMRGEATHKLKFGSTRYNGYDYPSLTHSNGEVGIVFGAGELYLLAFNKITALSRLLK